jgi:hypothetical protein
MDRGIRAVWYDLPSSGKQEYLDWLHEEHLPSMLARPGYLWAAHVENVDTPEREEQSARRLTRTDDPSVPTGYRYLLLFGATDPHVLVDPSPAEMEAELNAEARRMLGLREAVRDVILVEVSRIEGPDAKGRQPGITPGPIIQLGTFNINAVENETEMNTWYSRSRFPLVDQEGTVGTRRLVSISGWPKHGILYEFTSLEAASRNLTDPSEWSRKVVDSLVHAPHSPTLGTRIWPPVAAS